MTSQHVVQSSRTVNLTSTEWIMKNVALQQNLHLLFGGRYQTSDSENPDIIYGLISIKKKLYQMYSICNHFEGRISEAVALS